MSKDLDIRLAALRRSFRDRLATDRAELRRLSADRSRRDELLACVHRLGGSAGTFGSPRISVAAERLEEHLRRGGDAAPGAALAALLDELEQELGPELGLESDQR